MTSYRPTEPADLVDLAPRLRSADLREIAASSGEKPLLALLRGYSESAKCFTMVGDGLVMGIFGVCPSGTIWLLGSDLISNHTTAFLRASLDVIEWLHDDYPVLWNFVDARNELHIKWLKWLGFEFIKLHPHFGVQQLPFWEFRKCVYQQSL